jgi:DNA-binding CsgD family transcriptional regulator
MIATDQRLWFFDQKRLSFFQLDALSSGLKRQTVSVTNRLLNTKSGYENVLAISRDTVLIGTADGYLLLAVDAIPLPRHEVHLNAVTYGQDKRLALDFDAEQGKATLPPGQNKLSFEFSVPTYSKFLRPKFQYRFIDAASSWSEWTGESELTLVDLNYGSYELEVRSVLGRRLSENKSVYSFEVARPWALSFPGLIVLSLGAIFFVGSLHRAYTNYYRKQRRKLEIQSQRMIAAQQKETELALSNLRNEQLKKDIEGKSQEMAASMMNLVKKNELLQEIKDILELKRPAQQNIKEVLNIIDSSLDVAENWNLFEEAFNHADRDFFHRIKEKHSKLTSNDLKLCAYLRLSLSSKEIAPLLNISLRSVEVKRYRLRKKLDLDHEVGLVDYIVSI